MIKTVNDMIKEMGCILITEAVDKSTKEIIYIIENKNHEEEILTFAQITKTYNDFKEKQKIERNNW